MGGLISVIISVLAAIAFYGTGHPLLFGLSVFIAALTFWSWGLMHIYARRSAKTRWDRMRDDMIFVGRTPGEIERVHTAPIYPIKYDVPAVPEWLSTTHMLATFVGVALLIRGINVRYF